MPVSAIVWICAGVFILLGLGPVLVMSYILFSVLLVRTGKDKWTRACSFPDDPVSKGMFDAGVSWAEKNRAYKKEVSVRSGRKNLFGEYYDFGFSRAAVILGGRCESMLYGYYFAELYQSAGYNVLVADPRAHGLSDGRVNTVGFREWRDLLRWGELLHGNFGMNHIFVHSLCIGSETALFALTSKECPDYFEGMCAEGMFTTFCETFRTHMIQQKKPTFPMLYFVMFWLFVCSGGNACSDGPLRRIGRMKKPILFLHSREDNFSLPEKSSAIYEKCTAPHETVWFPHGEHSRIRFADTENYDRAVSSFLDKYFPREM